MLSSDKDLKAIFFVVISKLLCIDSRTIFAGDWSGEQAISSIILIQVHGVLNAISWEILFPICIVIARYVETFQSSNPAWFYLHVTCQFSAYAIAVAGWATRSQAWK